MGVDSGRRPENIAVTGLQKRRVLGHLARRGSTCHHCGGADFTVGDALYLGFLFLDEDIDTYMVALTCTNPECAVPHTGVRMRRSQFLPGASAPAAGHR